MKAAAVDVTTPLTRLRALIGAVLVAMFGVMVGLPWWAVVPAALMVYAMAVYLPPAFEVFVAINRVPGKTPLLDNARYDRYAEIYHTAREQA